MSSIRTKLTPSSSPPLPGSREPGRNSVTILSTTTPEESSPLSDIKEETVASWNTKEIVERLFETKTLYNNSRQPIIIDEELKKKLESLSRIFGIEMSRLVNNALNILLDTDSPWTIHGELEDQISERHKTLCENFSSKRK